MGGSPPRSEILKPSVAAGIPGTARGLPELHENFGGRTRNRVSRRTGPEQRAISEKEDSMKMSRTLQLTVVMVLAATLGFAASGAYAQGSHTSSQFQGPKANKGTVSHSSKD